MPSCVFLKTESAFALKNMQILKCLNSPNSWLLTNLSWSLHSGVQSAVSGQEPLDMALPVGLLLQISMQFSSDKQKLVCLCVFWACLFMAVHTEYNWTICFHVMDFVVKYFVISQNRSITKVSVRALPAVLHWCIILTFSDLP